MPNSLPKTLSIGLGLLLLCGGMSSSLHARPEGTDRQGADTVTPSAGSVSGLPPSAKKPKVPPIPNLGGGSVAGLLVEICPNGCPYTDLASACAAVTSTVETPVTFHVGPGRYVSELPISCSGQDHAVFRGSGPGVTILENSNQRGYYDYGTFEPGTSSNYVIEQFTIIGHRAIHMDMQLVGGGNITIRENDLRSPSFNLDEDCVFIRDPSAGTRLHLEHNRCEYKADGFTLKSDQGRDLQIYAKANHFTSANDPSLYGAWHFESAPCVFVSQGESFDLTGGRMDGGVILSAYDFQNWSGGGCPTPAQYTIIGPSVKIVNTDAPGDGGGGKFMNITADVNNVGQITVVGAQADISTTDSARGYVYGIYNESSAAVIDVIGGRFRTSGGGNVNLDFDGHLPGTRIRLYGVDYQTRQSAEAGGINVTAGDLRSLMASEGASLGPTTITTPGPGEGLVLYDARTTFHDQSPYLTFKTSPGGLGSKTWKLQANGLDRFTLTNPDGTIVLEWRTAGGTVDIKGGINMINKTGEISLGDGTPSDSTKIRFNGANDATLGWIESARRLTIAGPDVVQIPTSLSKPPSCSAGDMRVMTNGTFCFCTNPGTPGNWTGVGGGNCNQ
jgi:hypothetical protein